MRASIRELKGAQVGDHTFANEACACCLSTRCALTTANPYQFFHLSPCHTTANPYQFFHLSPCHRRASATPSARWILSECCSRRGCGHLPTACLRRSNAADLEEL